MKRYLSLLALCLSFLTATAQAGFYHGEYRLGLFKDTLLDATKITHVIVIGSAVKEDSNQFFQSGMSRAQRYKELWPDHQVVFLSSPEVRGADDDEVFAQFGIAVIKVVKDNFTGDLLINELSQFDKLASLDFYGHSSPWALKLGKSDSALDIIAYEKSITKLRAKFLPNAYATLNACSTGFILAPALSRMLQIPVSGSLTSSLFERIESDGHWYKEDDWTRENYVEKNDVAYTEPLNCIDGYCWRMKASRYSYSSYWGVFDSGLSFYKFFCDFDNADHRCEKGMAKSLLSFPSVRTLTENSTTEEFKTVVFDWLCSTAKDKSYFQKCVTGITQAVARGDLVFQSHPGNELICNFKGCEAKIVCKGKLFGGGPKGGSCKAEFTPNAAPVNAAREYLSLMDGFKLLNSK
jgi:hypothetical protein